MFYGWWIVVACMVSTMFGNALGLFGAGVYLHALTDARGWPVGLVSGAVTLFYLLSAVLLIPVGQAIGRVGPRPVLAIGAVAMALGVAAVGRVEVSWQAYAAFLLMGVGWACLSTTAIAATIAPWFERHQGRAMSTASLGASAGGLAGTPLLLLGIRQAGLEATTTVAAVLAALAILPLAAFVLRRRPQDMGLLPDGIDAPVAAKPQAVVAWTRRTALGTTALRSVMVAFGIGMMVQIGFLTHQVALSAPVLGESGTAAMVAATAAMALLGRLLLARFADRVDQRKTAGVVLLLAALALSCQTIAPVPAVLVGSSLLIGLTVGNVTTLAPIIVRREFGAASFGAIFGVASCGIQLAAAAGPGLYGLLYDLCGGYGVPLLLAAAADVGAAAVVIAGRRPTA